MTYWLIQRQKLGQYEKCEVCLCFTEKRNYIALSDCISIDKNGFFKHCIGVSLSAIIYSKRLHASSIYLIAHRESVCV